MWKDCETMKTRETRQNIEVIVLDEFWHKIPDKVVKFMEYINEKTETVPEEYKDSCNIEAYDYFEYGESYSKLKIYYYRKETKEEANLRLEKESKSRKEYLKRLKDTIEKLEKEIPKDR